MTFCEKDVENWFVINIFDGVMGFDKHKKRKGKSSKSIHYSDSDLHSTLTKDSPEWI